MIRHVVLFRWKPGFDPAPWLALVTELPARIPVIRSLSVGQDLVGADRFAGTASWSRTSTSSRTPSGLALPVRGTANQVVAALNLVVPAGVDPVPQWSRMSAVNDVPLPDSALAETAVGLADVAAEFADEAARAPTLAEFLEILGWSLPVGSEFLAGGFLEPLPCART